MRDKLVLALKEELAGDGAERLTASWEQGGSEEAHLLRYLCEDTSFFLNQVLLKFDITSFQSARRRCKEKK